MLRLAIIGAGGHGRVVAEIAESSGWKTIHFYEDSSKKSKLKKKTPSARKNNDAGNWRALDIVGCHKKEGQPKILIRLHGSTYLSIIASAN